MAKLKIVWTALPYGRMPDRRGAEALRVSLVVSPRLTPETIDEQVLGAAAYGVFHHWPETLKNIRFRLHVPGAPEPLPLEMISEPSTDLWDRIFSEKTPVAGFRFSDMSRVNLRSYPVRKLIGFVREHYGKLAVDSALDHPVLLPWRAADPALKGMLENAGTATQKYNFGDRSVEVAQPGFDRFFGRSDSKGPDTEQRRDIEQICREQVFGPNTYRVVPVVNIEGQRGETTFPMRVLPSEWHNAAGPGAALMAQFNTADEYTLYQANRFYRRSEPSADELKMRRPDLKNVSPRPKVDDFDFHRIIASLADYPQVMRRLGLVIDCLLPADNPIVHTLLSQAMMDGTISVEADWSDGHDAGQDVYPSTAFRATADRFVVRERTADHASGLMALAGTCDPTLPLAKEIKQAGNFDIFQLDPDGAALKTSNFLLTAQNLVARSLKMGSHGEVTYTTGDRQPVAALRSGGLGISRHARAEQVAQDAAAAFLKNDVFENKKSDETRKVVLFAEDVLRGYRVDVNEKDKWLSLCQREGEYRLEASDERLEFAADEGYVKGASTTGDGSDDHYLHEAVFRWTGWSLVAPRPGRKLLAVSVPKSGLQGEALTDIDEAGGNGNGLKVHFHAARDKDKRLPRLRFGHEYRLRARLVDLAGNSLEVDDPGIGKHEQATEVVRYLRFEPLDPPVLVHKHRVSEGESLERMVIRSNYNVNTRDYLSTDPFRLAIAEPESADFEYLADNQRHVVPPKASQLQCEQHGLFDQAFGSGSPDDIKAMYEVAAREAGSLFDPLPSAKVELVTPASAKAVAQTTSVPPEIPSETSPTGGRLVGGQYVIHYEDDLETPYLPDGAAGGIVIRGENSREDFRRIGINRPLDLGPCCAVLRVAATEELILVVKNDEPWPKTRGLRIVLEERAGDLADDGSCTETFPDDGVPKWDADNRLLTLFVRKGNIVRLRYSSFVSDQTVEQFGIAAWGQTAAQRAQIADMARLGMHWMITPHRSLVLVHATQQPVCKPLLQGVTAPREAGATFTDLDARVSLHGPSTGKFEVVAEWEEWIDDPQQSEPKLNAMQGQLVEIPLSENHVNQFGLQAAADAAQEAPASVSGPSQSQRLKGNRHEFGDTRFRLVRYRLEATTRFREYLPPALYAQREQITRVGDFALETLALSGAETDFGAPVLFDVPGAQPNGTCVLSSHAPDVPRVVYVVPTFRWLKNLVPGQAQQDCTRFGNGLRVYLERPWFSSGNGELLGVVLSANNQEFKAVGEEMLPYVTQWGLDPLFDTAIPSSHAKANDFTARICSGDVALQETGGLVHVVGHRVQWDGERKLWYADIEINPGLSTYMPFVRLALVRYQPHSIGGAEISQVVLAEFSQLLPRRFAALNLQGQQVSIDVHGPVPSRGPILFSNEAAVSGVLLTTQMASTPESGRNKIELVLQTRDPDLDSDLAWRDVKTLASALAAPATVTAAPNRLEPLGGLFSSNAQAAPTSVQRSGNLGETLHFADQLELAKAFPEQLAGADLIAHVTTGGAMQNVGDLLRKIDPAIWQANVTLPVVSGPARLVLREFERYYTDRTVPEAGGPGQRQRRVVEERLIYSAFFPLN